MKNDFINNLVFISTSNKKENQKLSLSAVVNDLFTPGVNKIEFNAYFNLLEKLASLLLSRFLLCVRFKSFFNKNTSFNTKVQQNVELKNTCTQRLLSEYKTSNFTFQKLSTKCSLLTATNEESNLV